MLGFDKQGEGDHGVMVLNDWMSDVSSWDGTRPYLGHEKLRWVFADLRGYGRSRGQGGEFTLTEAAADVLALAGALGWRKFSVVGHSMSSLVALHLAQHHADRVERVVILTPPPPRGFGADEATLQALRDVARGDDAKRLSMLQYMWGDRLSQSWKRFKAERWRRSADAEAAAQYVDMFARDGLPDALKKIHLPLLALTGEQDSEPLRKEAVAAALRPIADDAVVVALANCGHDPMQEVPPLLATLLERFLAEGEVG